MAKKIKNLKPKNPTKKDLSVHAKRTGYRFKTGTKETNPKLHKKDGTLNVKGEALYYKKPDADEIEDFKKEPDGSYPDNVKQVYHESRQDRTHSDDVNKKRVASKKLGKGYFEDGGETLVVELSCEQMKNALGREPKYPCDYIDGKKYEKCFLRPFYKCVG